MLCVRLLIPRDPGQLIVTLQVQTLFSRPIFYLLRNFEKSAPASRLPKGLKSLYNHLENEVLNEKKKEPEPRSIPNCPWKGQGCHARK